MNIHDDAPVITRDEIEIHASIERIWQIQTDINAWPTWQPDIDTAELDGPLRVGGSFHWTTFGLDITSTVTEIVEPARIVWGGPASGITAIHVWELSQTPTGVRVKTQESWEGDPIDSAPAEMQQALDASLASWLQRLKECAERA